MDAPTAESTFKKTQIATKQSPSAVAKAASKIVNAPTASNQDIHVERVQFKKPTGLN